ncbi:GNAT family N-acetyltransferase [Streptomyces sp. CA-294286]|uniref:GNAT family N-acetyltransferase n=1 Tax=Streptomyces sp. CA-294286 TaxID=3240070 RepID=UPI003D8D85D2
MNLEAVRELFDTEMRREATADHPGVTLERVGDVVRRTSRTDDWNGVLWTGLTEATADAAIAEQVRHFRAHGLDFEWKHYAHDRPQDLGRRLLAAGFVADEPEALMVAETASLPTEPVLPEGVRLVRVTDRSGVDLMVRAHESAFGGDARKLGEEVLAQLTAAPDTVEVVVAMAGDEPVSAARAEFPPGTQFASLWGGGTAPEWRGRGVYRALVAHRTRLAVERGYRYLQVDALDTSRPILQRLGFARLSTTTPYNFVVSQRH